MLEQYGLMLALACAGLAIVYGVVTARWIVSQPAGNERMQQIAAAVQEGAGAYLRRQYTTIAIVGAIVFSAITVLPGIPTSAFDVTLSPDELVIVYAEQSQAGRRGLVATRPSTTDGFGVGVPVPELASPILDPFVSHDGCELLFATDRGRQPGDHAIWYATMNP